MASTSDPVLGHLQRTQIEMVHRNLDLAEQLSHLASTLRAIDLADAELVLEALGSANAAAEAAKKMMQRLGDGIPFEDRESIHKRFDHLAEDLGFRRLRG